MGDVMTANDYEMLDAAGLAAKLNVPVSLPNPSVILEFGTLGPESYGVD
jgi:hypothetical protein